jgi:putative transposase
MVWARMLAYITGTVDQELLLRNEYLAAENHILKAQIKGRLLLCDGERATLAEIAYRLGRKALEEVALVAKPETILGWYRKLIAKKFDGSKSRSSPGRPRVDGEIESLIVRMAKENPGWGYERIVGALGNLGYPLSDQTVGNILRRHGVAPAPRRKHTVRWKEFIRTHLAVLAGTDFFTAEVLTWKGPVTYHVLFFIHLESRRVCLAGITRHPDQEWMEQQARTVTLAEWGFLHQHKYLLHDRDAKFCASFRQLIETNGRKAIALPARSPNLNAYAERWVRSVKEECLSKLILFGEGSLRRALQQYVAHYHEERNHQGRQNQLLFPRHGKRVSTKEGAIRCGERLGGLLKYYEHEAAHGLVGAGKQAMNS